MGPDSEARHVLSIWTGSLHRKSQRSRLLGTGCHCKLTTCNITTSCRSAARDRGRQPQENERETIAERPGRNAAMHFKITWTKLPHVCASSARSILCIPKLGEPPLPKTKYILAVDEDLVIVLPPSSLPHKGHTVTFTNLNLSRIIV
jgi:hypothetical protein